LKYSIAVRAVRAIVADCCVPRNQQQQHKPQHSSAHVGTSTRDARPPGAYIVVL